MWNSTVTMTVETVHDEKPTVTDTERSVFHINPTGTTIEKTTGSETEFDDSRVLEGVTTQVVGTMDSAGAATVTHTGLTDPYEGGADKMKLSIAWSLLETLFLFEEAPVNVGNDTLPMIYAAIEKFYSTLTYQPSSHAYTLPVNTTSAYGFKQLSLRFENQALVNYQGFYRFDDYYDGPAASHVNAVFSNIGSTTVSYPSEIANALAYHTISCYSDDGTTLLGKAYALDKATAKVHFMPGKAAVDSTAAYRFVSWDKDLSNVTSDLSVNATFESVPAASLYALQNGKLGLASATYYPTSLILPDTFNGTSVTVFDFTAAYVGSFLDSITLNASLSNLIMSAVGGIGPKTAVSLGSNTAFALKGHSLYSADGKTLYRFADADITSEVSLPAGLTTIKNYACRYSAFDKVNFPASLTSIGTDAFQCSSISSVNLPEGFLTLSDGCFGSALSLTSVVLPESCVEIPDSAFRDDSRLASCTHSSVLKTIGSDSFYRCSSLTAFVFDDALTGIGSEAFEGSGLTSLTLSRGVFYLNNQTFNGCKDLVSVMVPKEVTKLGEYLFADCYALTSVTFEDASTLVSVGAGCFARDVSLTSLDLGASKLTELPGRCFAGMDNLTSVVLPSTITSEGGLAFEGDSLVSIYLMATTDPSTGWDSNWRASDASSNPTVLRPYYLYSETEPASNPTSYWHYISGVPTVYGA